MIAAAAYWLLFAYTSDGQSEQIGQLHYATESACVRDGGYVAKFFPDMVTFKCEKAGGSSP